MPEDLVNVGRLFRPQGLKGELKAEVSLPSNFNFYELADQRIILKKPAKPKEQEVTVESIKPLNRGYSIKFFGIDDLGGANELKDSELFLRKSVFKKLPENEFFVDDLVGLKVFSTQQVFDIQTPETEEALEIGEVKELILNPANHLLKIILKDSGRSFLLPMVDEYIEEINLDEKKVIVKDWQLFAE